MRKDELIPTQAIDFCRRFEQEKTQMKQMKKERDVDTDVYEANEATAITLINNVCRIIAQIKVVSFKFCGNKHKNGRYFAQHIWQALFQQ